MAGGVFLCVGKIGGFKVFDRLGLVSAIVYKLLKLKKL
jgi:hypothetical protein